MPMLDIVTGACSKVIDLVREKASFRTHERGSTFKVEAVMTSPPVACHPDMPLSEVAHLMWTHEVGFLPVVARDSGQIVGVITDRDALMGAFTQGKPLWEVAASMSMAKPVHTCAPDMTLDEAERIMGANHVHRLPVVDAAQRLVGVLSLHDVARKARAIADPALEREVGVALGAICAPATSAEPLH
jgi:CBS domain-containing protein